MKSKGELNLGTCLAESSRSPEERFDRLDVQFEQFAVLLRPRLAPELAAQLAGPADLTVADVQLVLELVSAVPGRVSELWRWW